MLPDMQEATMIWIIDHWLHIIVGWTVLSVILGLLIVRGFGPN